MALTSSLLSVLGCAGIGGAQVERSARLLENVTGRDKIMRTLQYVFKLAAFLHSRRTGLSAKQSELVALLDNLVKALGDGRRLFRLLKCLSSSIAAYKGVLANVMHKRNAHGAANAAARNALFAAYYLLDHYIWLIKLKLVEDEQRLSGVQLLSMRLWSVATLVGLACDLHTYFNNPPASPEARKTLKTKLVKSSCDLPLAFTSSFPEQAKLVSPGLVYAAGVVASLSGLLLAWNDV